MSCLRKSSVNQFSPLSVERSLLICGWTSTLCMAKARDIAYKRLFAAVISPIAPSNITVRIFFANLTTHLHEELSAESISQISFINFSFSRGNGNVLTVLGTSEIAFRGNGVGGIFGFT